MSLPEGKHDPFTEAEQVKGFQVLVFYTHEDRLTYSHFFVPGFDREEAGAAGHLAAQEMLGQDTDYHVVVTPATQYRMPPTEQKRHRK